MKTKDWKKSIAVIFFMVLALSVLIMFDSQKAVYADGTYSGGNGLSETPYEIATTDDLIEFAATVSSGLQNGYYNKYFILKNDIDLTEYVYSGTDAAAKWQPVGTQLYPFKGYFNGDGYGITGLQSERGTTDGVGLFGVTSEDAVIKNVTIKSGLIIGRNYTAGIVGYNKGQIINCVNNADISDAAGEDAMHVAGIAGYNFSTGIVEKCSNSGTVSTTYSTVGGIVGSNFGQVSQCYNTGIVTTQDMLAGGIVGSNEINSEISECFNSGSVTADNTVGGICGNNNGTITNVYNTGAVAAVKNTAGGISGGNAAFSYINNAYNASTVTGQSTIAGICAYNLGDMQKVFCDSALFSGELANGNGNVYDQHSGTSYEMTAADVLSDGVLTGLASDEGLNKWYKRSYDNDYCYYPELQCFQLAEREIASSKASAQYLRVDLGSADFQLKQDTFTYDGQPHVPDLILSEPAQTALTSSVDYTAVCSNNTNAGTAEIQIVFQNFYKGSITKNYTISKKEVIIAWVDGAFSYTGKAQYPKVRIVSGNVGGELPTFEYDCSGGIVAGGHNVEALLEENTVNSNYFIQNSIKSYTIDKAVLTIAWDTPIFTYTGEYQAPSASVTAGGVSGETIVFDYSGEGGVFAGSHKVTVQLTDNQVNENYVLQSSQTQHSYSIAKKTVTLTWDDQILYYIGAKQHPTAIVNDLCGEEIVALSYLVNGSGAGINANEGGSAYVVNASLVSSDVSKNYTLSDNSLSYYIHKSIVTIAWWDDVLTYKGTSQYPSFYIDKGRIGEDEILFTISDYSQNINAGSGYSVTIRLSDSAKNANYYFADLTKIYEIKKADFNPAGLTLRSYTYSYDGEAKSLSIEDTLPPGVFVSYENNGQIQVGEYLVKAIFEVDPDNYNPLTVDNLIAKISIAAVSFEVLDGQVKVEILNGNVAYGLEANVTELAKDKAFTSDKQTQLTSYSVSFTKDKTAFLVEGETQYSIRLTESQAKKENLTVFYMDSAGNINRAESVLENGVLSFSAVGCVKFAVFADRSYLFIWLTIIGIGLIIAIAGILIIVRRKRAAVIVNKPKTVSKSLGTSEKLPENDFSPAKTETAVPIKKSADIITAAAIAAIVKSEPTMKKQRKPTASKKPPGFILDGVKCHSLSSFMAALRYKTSHRQKEICQLPAAIAKKNSLAKKPKNNVIYWLGKKYVVDSLEYNELLKRARIASRNRSGM